MVDEKKQASGAKISEAKKNKPRSPGYPAIDLEKAIEKARELHKQLGRHEADETSVYKILGYAGRSGTSATVLAALKAFGLVEASGAGWKISQLANRIFIDNRPDTTEKAAMIREAALKPAMHKYMFDTYGATKDLPADSVMEFHLQDVKAFTAQGAKQFIEEYKATMAFVGGTDGANMSSDGEDETPEEVQMNVHSEPSRTLNTGATRLPDQPLSPGMREVPIPIAGSVWPSIKAPFPLTEAAWTQMILVLNAMKPGLVTLSVNPDDADPA